MKLFKYAKRSDYFDSQIARSQKKAEYCKVYFSDVIRYRKLIALDQSGPNSKRLPVKKIEKILCLGVRSGAEVDIFRTVFFGPLMRLMPVQSYASQRDNSRLGESKVKLAHRLGIGSGSRNDGRVIGVEINPEAKRDDIWIGSFDELPSAWTGHFDIVFSNSLDHSQFPEDVVAEWRRVAARGAYVILGFTPGNEVSVHDPLGGLDYKGMQELWKLPIVFLSDTFNKNGYKEICFRLV